MSLDRFTGLYLDWLNNFLTLEKFAEHHGISLETAEKIRDLGRAITKLEE